MKMLLPFLAFFAGSYLSLFSQTGTTRTSMAVLKVKREVPALINNQVMFMVKPGQAFIYDWEAKNAYLENGDFGFIPDSLVNRITALFFKFNFSKDKFRLEPGNELLEASNRHRIEIQSIIDRVAFAKSEPALIEFCSVRKYMDGAAAEIWDQMLFQLINSWEDAAFAKFLSGRDASFLKAFSTLITSEAITFPITSPGRYYRSYYPQSWKVIGKYK